ncbi:MAG: diadenylate cyclase, partial [Bacteroidota bacterium]
DEVIDAVHEMSEKHIGALIVFPRSQNVQMTIDTGIPLQATVSKELLLSIFNTKSPLHDGAVIVDEQMIVAARCILPLSNITKSGGRNLGTRHRAALGLSEQIDTIVLIVSEETGSISIAESGNLMLNIPVEQLPSTLSAKLAEG